MTLRTWVIGIGVIALGVVLTHAYSRWASDITFISGMIVGRFAMGPQR